MASTHDKSIELKQLGRILWRRKGLMILSIISVLCAAIIGLRIIPEQYRSSADIAIQEPESLSLELTRVIGRGPNNFNARGADERRLTQMAGKVRSSEFLERVVRVLSMHKDPRVLAMAESRREQYPSMTTEEIAIRFLVRSLEARIAIMGRGPGLYRIAVSDYNPGTAKALAHWISELFIDEMTREELDRIQSARTFSQEQLRIYQDELTRAENALRRYRESLIGTALADNPIRSDNMRRAEELHKDLLEDERVTRDRIGARTRQAINAGLPAEDPSLREDREIRGLASEVSSVLTRTTRAQISHPVHDPMVVALNSELVQARNGLYRALERRARELYANTGTGEWTLMADLAFAQLDADCHAEAASSMNLLVLDFKRRVRAEPGHEIELKRLTGEVSRKREVLQSFEKQIVASELQQRVETTDLGTQVEIIDRAQLPMEPFWPNKSRILILACLMGPVLGAGMALLSELLDPTLRSLFDISRIAPEPVLGTLPLMDSSLPLRGGLRRRWIPVTVMSVLALTVAFFVVKERVLPDLGVPDEAIQAVEPVEGEAP